VLKFIVPLLILGLVTPAIADVGKGAGKLLASVMVLSYLSTIGAAFFAYLTAGELLPHYVSAGLVSGAAGTRTFEPYIALKIPPVCDVLTALALAFMLGIGMNAIGAQGLRRAANDFGEIVRQTIQRVIIPGIPLYIFTMICEMTASGKFSVMAGTMLKVIVTGIALTLVYLVLIFTIAGIVTRRNPLRALWSMVPAYLTGLSILSSSAVIPVTLRCCERIGISADVRNFVVPICANVHMVGSAIKMLTTAVAIMILYGLHPSFPQVANFIFMMGIAAVAAPGVMAGVLMASIGFFGSILGFTEEQTGLLMTFYLAFDGYGPAANVTGDAAIAMICERFFGTGGKGK